MNLETMVGILIPAFLTGLLVLSTHVPLGRQVLARGIIFIDLAVAQIAGLGVIAAYTLQLEPGGWQVQLIAGAAALAGALALYLAERRWPEIQEALIGTAFVLAATGGILLLAQNPQGAEHLQDLLAGQILWVTYAQLGPLALFNIVILGLWMALGQRGGSLAFYLLFALAVTAAVQLVGVFLVFASLIIPALAIRHLDGTRALMSGYALGAGGYALGLVLSAAFDLPSGAIIVWALAAFATGSSLCRSLSPPEVTQ
ncbi:MAG TPA: metal ABC transporter permease [Gammaproteobacteria bacterium]|nr:metal ABC transporter permease [Gammaproteobacteria bacterium]